MSATGVSMKARGALGASLVLGLFCALAGAESRADQVGASRIPPAVPGSVATVPRVDSGEDIRDIHGPIAISARRSPCWYLAAAGALAAVGVALTMRAHRRRPALAPHERALRALAGAQLLVGDDAREFAFVASETVRVYVEEAFGVRAAHRTTEELLVDLMQDTSPVATHRVELSEFLRHCDLAKFGGWSLSRADMAAMLGSAEAFVRATATQSVASPVVPTTALRSEGVA